MQRVPDAVQRSSRCSADPGPTTTFRMGRPKKGRAQHPGHVGIDGRENYFASSFERRVAAATARVSSDCMPSGPISTSSAAAVVPPGEVTF